MKYSTLKILGIASLLVLLSSCEKILDFDLDRDKEMCVYAFAVADQPISVRVSRSFTIKTNPKLIYSSDPQEYYDYMDRTYNHKIAIHDAEPEILVNGNDRYKLKYTGDTILYDYSCEYIPKIGDNIEIKVKAGDFKETYANTKVEEPQKIEVLKVRKMYKNVMKELSEEEKIDQQMCGLYGSDTVMVIKLKITDPPKQHNFYRLRVRSVAKSPMLYAYTVSDLFSSDDIIFIDNMLTKPFGKIPARFSNVFDDKLIDGKEHTFEIESRLRIGNDRQVIIDLQSLSPDLYYFLKTERQYKTYSDDMFQAPLGIHTNIENGWGILGSISYSRLIISPDDVPKN